MDLENGSDSSEISASAARSPIVGAHRVYFIEMLRIVLTCAGYAIAYHFYFQDHFVASVRWLQVSLTSGLCGTSVIEGIWCYEAAGRLKGYDESFNYEKGRNPYQTQNTLWFAASFFVGCATFCAYAKMAPPQVVIVVLQLVFFSLSAINHSYEAVVNGKWQWQNINRPIFSLSMIAGAVPILIKTVHAWLCSYLCWDVWEDVAGADRTPLVALAVVFQLL